MSLSEENKSNLIGCCLVTSIILIVVGSIVGYHWADKWSDVRKEELKLDQERVRLLRERP